MNKENSTPVLSEAEEPVPNSDLIDTAAAPPCNSQPVTGEAAPREFFLKDDRGGLNPQPQTPKLSGGQPGNQNARKHGFYARNLTASEKEIFEEASKLSGLDAEKSLLRYKLHQVMADDPDNYALISKIACAIARIEATAVKPEPGERSVHPIIQGMFERMVETAAQKPGGAFGQAIDRWYEKRE